MSSSTRLRSGSGGGQSSTSPSSVVGRKAALKEKIVQMYEVLGRGEEPERSAFGETFWAEFFLLRPKVREVQTLV